MNDSTPTTDSASWGRRQRLLSWGNAVLMVVILIAILAGVNYLVYKHPLRIDMTFAKLYTLDWQTKEVIARITKDVDVVISYFPDLEVNADIARRSHDLLEEYTRANRRIRLDTIDLLLHPIRARETAERLGFMGKQLPPNSVIFYSQGCKKTLDFMELYEGETLGFGEAERIKKFKGEQMFTSALLAVTEGRKRKVYWDQGHGTPPLGSREPHGFDTIVEMLTDRENCDVRPLVLSLTDALPDDCELYVIAGTTEEFTERDLALIDQYLEQGGKLLVMVNPFKTNGLEKLLRKWGVDVKQEYVIDAGSHLIVGPGRGLQCMTWPVVLNTYGSHAIVKGLQGKVQSIIPETCGMVAVSKPPRDVEVISLLDTSDRSWAKTLLQDYRQEMWEPRPGIDRLGPISIAMAIQASSAAADKPYKNVRIVVVGDSDMIVNRLPLELQIPRPLEFFMNSIRWLLEREHAIRVSPREPHDPTIQLTEGNTRFVFVLSIFVLPGLAVIFGIVVWLRRRL